MIRIARDVTVLDDRVLHVADLEGDSTSFTVRYRLTPALDDGPDAPLVGMALEANDDLGGEHLDGGGARGPSEDGTATVGSITAQPGIADRARTITLRFRFLTAVEEREYAVRVDLT